MRIAILYICTGAYVYFWEGFYRSFSEKFIPEAEKDYFVFTDADGIYAEDTDAHIHRIPQENLGWPGNTLYRFRIFQTIRERLSGFDYVFYLNSNLICLETISGSEFLPGEKDLLVVQHPGNYAKRPYRYPYDRNPSSRAYIPYTCLQGRHYVCGGLNGGKAAAYLDMIAELERRIDADAKQGVIAQWHDESQINRYIIDHPSYRMLPPSYAYPEGWDLPFAKKIMLLDKQKYIPLPAGKAPVRQKNTGSLVRRAFRSLAARGGSLLKKIRTGLFHLGMELYFRAHGV